MTANTAEFNPADALRALGACPYSLAWLQSQPSGEAAWANCTELGWMTWLLSALGMTAQLRQFACECALSVADKWNMPTIVRQYLTTRDESIRVEARKAANAAYAARDAAYDAAYDAAAAAAAYAAAAARDAVYDAAAAYAANAAAAAAAYAYAYAAAAARAWAARTSTHATQRDRLRTLVPYADIVFALALRSCKAAA